MSLCGNGICGTGEDCDNCPADCPCPSGTICDPTLASCVVDACGDGICDVDEDCDTCAEDCACAPGEACDTSTGVCEGEGECGDGTCGSDEDCESCQEDCTCSADDVGPDAEQGRGRRSDFGCRCDVSEQPRGPWIPLAAWLWLLGTAAVWRGRR